MTLYYSLCFVLLVAEASFLTTILSPMPFGLRRKMFHFLAENPAVAKVQYALKITFIFVAVLFIDASQRMVRIAQEGAVAKRNPEVAADVRTETTYAARRFYAQRNLYLTGTTLFSSLVSSRVFYILLDFIQTQEELTTLKGSTAKGSTNAGENAELRKKIKVLQAELETVQSDADRDLSTLKKQANQQAAEYNRLADEHNASTGAVSDKKFD